MKHELTVLMAVYNASAFIRTAIESIRCQTYRDFDFLIVDDGSTDDTREIVRSYDDARIELLCLERNVGQTAALNIGLRHASTAWIARMDADDYSAAVRLDEEMRMIEEDESLECVGTYAWEFRDDPQVVETIISRPRSHPEIKRAALEGAGLIHGSIVISRVALLEIGAYNERFRYASDREMFLRFLVKHRAANVLKPLLGIRRHPNQDSYSEVAADEYIDIFAGMLVNGGYSPDETAILRRSLSYSYLFRARCRRKKRQHVGWGRDVVSAFCLSPITCLRGFVGSVFPERLRASLRRGVGKAVN